jgi:hypothetical protein
MHATNTFPVDRHPQYRHYPTTIRSIASGIIIEVEKIHISLSILYLPFVPLRQKWGVYISFWTGNVFLTGLVIFVQNGQRGSLLVFDWHHSVDKITIM